MIATQRHLDDCNFRNRAWKTILTRLKIDYRKPYTTRHTLVSHALDLGMSPVMVAQLTTLKKLRNEKARLENRLIEGVHFVRHENFYVRYNAELLRNN